MGTVLHTLSCSSLLLGTAVLTAACASSDQPSSGVSVEPNAHDQSRRVLLSPQQIERRILGLRSFSYYLLDAERTHGVDSVRETRLAIDARIAELEQQLD